MLKAFSKSVIVIAALSLTACQSTGNKIAGICQIEESVSTFDKSNEVNFTECWVSAGESVWDIPSFKFGFSWSDKTPESIVLRLVYDSNVGSNAYTSFKGVSININGEISSFDNKSRTVLDSSGYNSVSNTIYTQSRSGIVIPMYLFEKMMTAEDVRVRVLSSDGYEDYIFSMEQNGMTKYAKFYLDDYLAAIEKHR